MWKCGPPQDKKVKQLRVKLWDGEGIYNNNNNKAYAIFYFGNGKSETSRVSSSCPPNWGTEMTLNIDVNQRPLILEVFLWNWHIVWKDDFAGYISINLNDIPANSFEEGIWFPLTSRPGLKDNPQGKLRLSLEWVAYKRQPSLGPPIVPVTEILPKIETEVVQEREEEKNTNAQSKGTEETVILEDPSSADLSTTDLSITDLSRKTLDTETDTDYEFPSNDMTLAPLAGKLLKQDPKGWTWRERWYQQFGDHIYYYAANGMPLSNGSRGNIPLKGIDTIRTNPKDVSSFQIIMNTGRTYTLKANDVETQRFWVHQLVRWRNLVISKERLARKIKRKKRTRRGTVS